MLHTVTLAAELSCLPSNISSELDQLNAPHPVHYKITSLVSAIIWVVVSEVSHSRDNDVISAAGIKYERAVFITESEIFTGILGFEPGGNSIKI